MLLRQSGDSTGRPVQHGHEESCAVASVGKGDGSTRPRAYKLSKTANESLDRRIVCTLLERQSRGRSATRDILAVVSELKH